MLYPENPQTQQYVPHAETFDLPQLRERELTADQIVEVMNRVNAYNAVNTWEAIQERYRHNPPRTESEIKLFGTNIDIQAKHEAERRLHDLDFVVDIEGCEGAKEGAKYGEKFAVPLLEGSYGYGKHIPFEERHRLAELDGHDRVKVVIDPVEGTTNAASNRSDAVSIIAGIKNGEIISIPTEEEARYMDRVVAPSRLKGRIYLDASPAENIDEVVNAYGVSAKDVEVVIMQRPRNEELIMNVLKTGARVRAINSGDLLPAIVALTQDRPILSMGSGGKEEAIIAALAAKAMGGVFEGRWVDKDGRPANQIGKIQTMEDVVRGRREDTFVSFASITGTSEDNFGIQPVVQVRKSVRNPHYNVSGASITGGKDAHLIRHVSAV